MFSSIQRVLISAAIVAGVVNGQDWLSQTWDVIIVGAGPAGIIGASMFLLRKLVIIANAGDSRRQIIGSEPQHITS